MKSVRVCLLVVLALLLPVRGAVAAAMLCPMVGAGTQTSQMYTQHTQHEQHGSHVHEQASPHAHSADHATDHGDAKGADRCNLCAAFCSLTPLVGGVPTMAAPLELATTAFPDFSAPSASFLSDGQERPPRSI